VSSAQTPAAAGAGAAISTMRLQLEHLRRQKDEEERAKRLDALAREAKRKAEQEMRRVIRDTPWTAAEVSSLAKAIKKYPGGTRDRWGVIADYVNHQCGHSAERCRSKDECIAKAARAGETDRKMADHGRTATDKVATPTPAEGATAADGWSPAQQVALETALATFPTSMDKKERWTKIAECVPGKTAKDCVARFKSIREGIKSAKEEAAKAKEKGKEGEKGKGKGSDGAASGGGTASADDEWSGEQQKALEDALAKHPASMSKQERWTKIAADVPGKTVKECVARFKAIRETLKI